jgi:hypothetical protein
MFSPRILAGVLLLAMAGALPAQLIAFDMNSGRRSAGLFFWDDGKHPGSFVFHYGTPGWKADYETLVEREQAETIRLGKDYWTTLENSLPLRLGETTLPVGHWYLALHKTQEGAFHIAAFDAARLRKARVPANTPDAGEPDLEFALTRERLDEVQQELRIITTANEEDPTRGTIALRWGPYRLATPFQALVEPTRQEAFSAALTDMLALLEGGQHMKLIRTYANPEFFGDMTDEQLGRLVEAFTDSDKPQQLADALRQVLAAELKVADDHTEVVYEDESLPRKKIRFAWLDGRWILADR